MPLMRSPISILEYREVPNFVQLHRVRYGGKSLS